MSRKRIAHRPDFPVRCACGNVFNTSDAHIGRQIACRCGRTLTIARPPDEYAAEYAAEYGAASAASAASMPGTSRKGASGPRVSTSDLSAAARRGLWTAWSATRAGIGGLFADSVLAMGSRRVMRRWTARLSWVFVVGALVSWALLVWASEQFLPATLLAYGPRFLLLAPLTLLVPAALAAARSALVPLAIGSLVLLGPVMGGRVSLRTIGRDLPAAPAPGTLRVLSYNTFGGFMVAQRLDEALALAPDLMAFQECGPALVTALEQLRDWHMVRYHTLCTLSRWPISGIDSMPRGDLTRVARYGFGGSALVVRHFVASPYGPLVFVNVHLETARKGLAGFTSGDGLVPGSLDDVQELARDATDETSAGERLALNTMIRARESERAAVWALRGDKSTPVIVAGDFNLPVESTIFSRHWGDFTDAFDAAGSGFGWTKVEGTLLRVRIDHVLGNEQAPTPVGAWVGPDLGSDHRPVVADLRWSRR